MEFIPLEKYSKGKPAKNLKKKETSYVDASVRKSKGKPFPVKNVKNKFRETLALKKKKKIPKVAKKQEYVDNDNDGGDSDDDDDDDDDVHDVEEEEDEELDESKDKVNEEEEKKKAKEEKCRKMDDKKKNRLFVKMKKKIHSEAQIKELHPDIKAVIFPRKKRSRWCWAVFTSEERAEEAFVKLKANPDVLVTKPTPYEMVERKREKKMKVIQRKKEIRKKLQQMWR